MKTAANRALFVALLGLCLSAGTFLPSATGRPPQDETEIHAVLGAYCQALTKREAAAVEGHATTPFWSNLQPRVGSGEDLGTFECVGGLVVLKPGLGTGQVLWTQPGGVKEVVTLTVVKQGPKWLVSGGPVP